ncbi:MAG: tRNA (adenosine(37)-N6)-threonylcarbamoyltransferase complex dimerization subunit type 1 TsaB [Planctomycetaceae bacterium]
MITLGIETSGPTASVALLRDTDCLDYRQLYRVGERPARNLVSEVQMLLLDCKVQPTDCDTLAVSIGPGSFTGLRIGTVFAKTFAFATDCSLVAVDTFLCVAHNSPEDVQRVWVVGDALRGDVYAGCYRRLGPGTWTAEHPPEIATAATWSAQLDAGDVVTGPGLQTIKLDRDRDYRALDESHWHPRANRLAEIGAALAGDGQLQDPFRLCPTYLRRSSAEDTWETQKQPSKSGRK